MSPMKNIVFSIVFLVVLLAGVILFLAKVSANPHGEPPSEDYHRMVQRAEQLSVKLVEGRISREEECEYQELCHRIGVYRVDHEMR